MKIAAATASTYMIPYAWKKIGPIENPLLDGLGIEASRPVAAELTAPILAAIAAAHAPLTSR